MPSSARLRFTGTLTSWHDARGFGFIEPSQGGQELFVHISAFPAGTGRPAVGLRLSFELAPGPKGQKRAVAVQFPLQPPPWPAAAVKRQAPPARWSLARAVAVPALLLLYAGLLQGWGYRPGVPLLYGVMSGLAFFAYVFDKSAAEMGRRRTPEKTLHLLALAGGWPGALLAQQLLRHKTSKKAFEAQFWATVWANLALLVLWHVFWRPGLR